MTSNTIVVNQDFGGVCRILGLPDPTAGDHAANKDYVDSQVEGLRWKEAVRVAVGTNVNISSPGATLDGQTGFTLNDRIVLYGQTDPNLNGIYNYNGAASPLTRANDGNTFSELVNAIVPVTTGTMAGRLLRQTQASGTIGSSPIGFSSFLAGAPSASTTQEGLIEIATAGEVIAGTANNLAVTPQTLKERVAPFEKLTFTIGDGSNNSFTLTHNKDTFDVMVQVYRNSGNRDRVLPRVETPTVNTALILFTNPPTANQYRVVIL